MVDDDDNIKGEGSSKVEENTTPEDDNKTEAERRHEEILRKRVSIIWIFSLNLYQTHENTNNILCE